MRNFILKFKILKSKISCNLSTFKLSIFLYYTFFFRVILRIKRKDVSNDYLLTNIYDLFYLAQTDFFD